MGVGVPRGLGFIARGAWVAVRAPLWSLGPLRYPLLRHGSYERGPSQRFVECATTKQSQFSCLTPIGLNFGYVSHLVCPDLLR